MKTNLLITACLLLQACSHSVPLPADSNVAFPRSSAAAAPEYDDEGRSLFRSIVLYVPDRVLDLLDIFRLRLRIGPGLAAGIRATEAAQLYAGSYFSLYAGLPGPRLRPLPKLPLGLESHSGVDISVLEASVGGGIGPDYSSTECGASLHALLLGADAGFDPIEAIDFAAGLIFIDIREDDL